MILHLFGKSHGCSKCDALKRKVSAVLEKHKDVGFEFHDLLTEDGLVPFCKVNINPNRVPALVISDDAGEFLQTEKTPEDVLKDKSVLYPYKGVCTDYSEEGHRGVITPAMIDGILS